jgi:hypothetical protein
MVAPAVDAPTRDCFDDPSPAEEIIIMKTIQITLPDDLHQRLKVLALSSLMTMKDVVLDAIEAHVVRMAAVTPESPTAKKGGSR